MKATYAEPTVTDLGSVATKTLGVPNFVSLEPTSDFRNQTADTASVFESEDGNVLGSNESFSLNSRPRE
jgi:hypothetical protein